MKKNLVYMMIILIIILFSGISSAPSTLQTAELYVKYTCYISTIKPVA